MDEYVLRVLELEEGLTSHRFPVRSEWLLGQLEGVNGITAGETEGTIELDVTRRGREVFLKGTVQAELLVQCVRCLENYKFEVDADLEVLMLPGKAQQIQGTGKGENTDEDDDLGVERYEGETIVIDGLIRDTILLEVPMNPNCGEQCPGWDRLTKAEMSL